MNEPLSVEQLAEIDAYWRVVSADYDALCVQGRAVASRPARFGPLAHFGVPEGIPCDADGLRCQQAARIVATLCAHARLCFAAPGTQLPIRDEDFIDQVYRAAGRGTPYRTFNPEFLPSKVWAALAARYAGTGAADSLRTAAGKLVVFFRLGRNPDVRQLLGAVDIAVRITTEDNRRWGREGFRLCFNASYEVRHLPALLRPFLLHAYPGDSATPAAVLTAALEIAQGLDQHTLLSRARFGNEHLAATVFSNSIRYRFSVDLATRLQEFIGEYAPTTTAQTA